MAQRMIDKEEAYTKIRNTRNFLLKISIYLLLPLDISIILLIKIVFILLIVVLNSQLLDIPRNFIRSEFEQAWISASATNLIITGVRLVSTGIDTNTSSLFRISIQANIPRWTTSVHCGRNRGTIISFQNLEMILQPLQESHKSSLVFNIHTVLPRLVRMRTIKLTIFFTKKNSYFLAIS